jgi:RNA polymerase sigma-70 factor (ECF subfamily)
MRTALQRHNEYMERDLLNRLSQGDPSALTHIYQHYWQSLYIQAYNVVKDKMVCEDIIQEIFLQIWKKRESLQITESLNAYLHAATRYQVFHYIRKTPVMEHLFEHLDERLLSEPSGQSLFQKDIQEQIEVIVSGLPEKCRQIYKLSREEYLPHKEIAEKLQISIKTVENQLTIALRRLRLSLKDATLLALVFMISV